jgi:hypothetical protein
MKTKSRIKKLEKKLHNCALRILALELKQGMHKDVSEKIQELITRKSK